MCNDSKSDNDNNSSSKKLEELNELLDDNECINPKGYILWANEITTKLVFTPDSGRIHGGTLREEEGDNILKANYELVDNSRRYYWNIYVNEKYAYTARFRYSNSESRPIVTFLNDASNFISSYFPFWMYEHSKKYYIEDMTLRVYYANSSIYFTEFLARINNNYPNEQFLDYLIINCN